MKSVSLTNMSFPRILKQVLNAIEQGGTLFIKPLLKVYSSHVRISTIEPAPGF